MATGANTIPLRRLHPILAAKMGSQPQQPLLPSASALPPTTMIPATAMGGLLPTPYQDHTSSPSPSVLAASKAAYKAASVAASLSSVIPMGSKDPELKKHLDAAKRAAFALFPGACVISIQTLVYTVRILAYTDCALLYPMTASVICVWSARLELWSVHVLTLPTLTLSHSPLSHSPLTHSHTHRGARPQEAEDEVGQRDIQGVHPWPPHRPPCQHD